MTQSIYEINRKLAEHPTAFITEAEADYDRQLSKIADHIAEKTCILVCFRRLV